MKINLVVQIICLSLSCSIDERVADEVKEYTPPYMNIFWFKKNWGCKGTNYF
jgi:hypothetical protein